MAVIDEDSAQPVPICVCSQTLDTPRLCPSPPIFGRPPGCPVKGSEWCGNWPEERRRGWRGQSSHRYLAGWPRNPVPKILYGRLSGRLGDFGPWWAAPIVPGRLGGSGRVRLNRRLNTAWRQGPTVPTGTESSSHLYPAGPRKSSATSVGAKWFRACPPNICPYREGQE